MAGQNNTNITSSKINQSKYLIEH